MPKAFLARMLMNLKAIYLQIETYKQALTTVDKLLLLRPLDIQQVRDRGLLHHRLQNDELAKKDLENYLRSHPNPPDGLQIQRIIASLK